MTSPDPTPERAAKAWEDARGWVKDGHTRDRMSAALRELLTENARLRTELGDEKARHADDTQEQALTPRVWTADDPEPAVGTRLRDKDGDEHVHLDCGWCMPATHRGYPHRGSLSDWDGIRCYAPFTEITEQGRRP